MRAHFPPRDRTHGLGPWCPWVGGGAALVLSGLLAGLCPVPLASQQLLAPNRGGFTVSMGEPPTWRWFAGASAAMHRQEEVQAAFYANASVYRDVANPFMAVLGVFGEGYIGSRGAFTEATNAVDGGLRLALFSPVIRLGIGWDHNFRDRESDIFLSLIHPVRRGGILVRGGALRIDYVPGRENSAAIGVRLPIGQPFIGRTRPLSDRVRLGNPRPPELGVAPGAGLRAAMAAVRSHGLWLYGLTVPFTDQWDGDYDEALERFVFEMEAVRQHLADGSHHRPPGATGPLAASAQAWPGTGSAPTAPDETSAVPAPIAEARAYHWELERAFSLATSDRPLAEGRVTPLGVATATAARAMVMEHVLLPYNRLLGQKKRSDSTRGLGASASAAFYEWLTRSPIGADRLLDTRWAFAELLDVVEEVRATARRSWGDSRLVWLPFQLALKPEQYDSQAELDAILEQATGGTFTRANKHWYIENEQFQAELTRMIREARDYHVLWIHDFRGYDEAGEPDEMSFRQVVHAYFPALIAAVRAYDQRGKMPQYFIFQDQMHYVRNGGKLFLDLLQDPLHHDMDLPDEYEAWEDSVAGLQAELADAVAGSELLQSQALHFRRGWIENLVKVHVSVTNPPDPSFWTREILPWPVGLPDLATRDHRKISFYDVSEEDPYRGMAMYTGAGVGEHYVGAAWEDRAMMIQGPMLLSLKDAARTLLVNQGFEPDQIPWELRPRPRAPGYEDMVADSLAALGSWGSDMELHNQIGFRPKPVSIAKATLYTLMPPGSVIKAPDSIWGSHFWAAMLIGHALRGGRSLVMSPSIANAPAPGFPNMAQAQDAMVRLVVAQEILGEEIAEAGGLLKVGIFNSRIPTGDIPRRILAFGEKLERTPWLRDLYGFHPQVVSGLRQQAQMLVESGFQRDYTIQQGDRLPKLHLKANYFATREAWDKLLARPDVVLAFQAYFEEIANQNQALGQGEYRSYSFLLEELLPTSHVILEDYMAGLTPEERDRVALFFLLGSHNQNNRSMMLDGEVAHLVASWSALFGFTDFLIIAGLCEWVEEVDELERLLPRYTGLKRRVSHWLRMVA